MRNMEGFLRTGVKPNVRGNACVRNPRYAAIDANDCGENWRSAISRLSSLPKRIGFSAPSHFHVRAEHLISACPRHQEALPTDASSFSTSGSLVVRRSCSGGVSAKVGSKCSATALPPSPPAIAPTAAPTTVPNGPAATVPAAAPAATPPTAAPSPTPTGCAPGAPVIGSRFVATCVVVRSLLSLSMQFSGVPWNR
jgi:hypothetical protein